MLFNRRNSFSVYFITLLPIVVSSMSLWNVRFVEQNDSRLVATSNYNYAIASPRLSIKNWRTVSVNGNNLCFVTISGEKILSTMNQLSEQDKILIEGLRDEIGNSTTGYTHVSLATGGQPSGGTSMTSSTGSNTGVSTSYSSSSSGFTSTNTGVQGSTMQINDMNINMRDDSNFSVSKSDLPFEWSRVFFNGDLFTFVYNNGEVHMLPAKALDQAQLEAANRLKNEVKNMQKTHSQQFSNTMQHSLDMVSNVFNNIMGTFPKPPSYSSAVGNMFGNNFPFGSNNSPFSSSSGWPFSSGAFAFAGR